MIVYKYYNMAKKLLTMRVGSKVYKMNLADLKHVIKRVKKPHPKLPEFLSEPQEEITHSQLEDLSVEFEPLKLARMFTSL